MDFEKGRYLGLYSQYSTPGGRMPQNYFTHNRGSTNRFDIRGNLSHSRSHFFHNNRPTNNYKTDYQREPKEYRKNRQHRGNLQNQRGKPASQTSSNSSLASSSTESIESTNSTYVCPGCKMPYDYSKSFSKSLNGRVPRILKCEHTMCEECIQKSVKTTNQVFCATCYESSQYKEDLDFNYYILGYITSLKVMAKPRIDFPNVSLSAEEHPLDCSVSQDYTCGSKNCENLSETICLDCYEQFCPKCDEAHHESNGQFNNHRRSNVNKISLELNKCPDHMMMEELFCSNCNKKGCCYCMLEKHEGHARLYLDRLTDAEKNELNDAFNAALKKKKHLQDLQKKFSILGARKMSTVEYNIVQEFSNLHVKLYLMEKKLIEESKKFNGCHSNTSVIRRLISSNLDNLNYLLKCFETQQENRMNLQGLLEKLKEMNNMPNFPNGNTTSQPVSLVINDEIYNLEKFFHLEPDCTLNSFLFNDDSCEMNQEYDIEIVEDEIKIVEDEIKIVEEGTYTLQSKISSDSGISVTKYSPKVKERTTRTGLFSGYDKTNFVKEEVYITQIHSLNKFYVQLKKQERSFQRMEKDIEKHVKTMKVGVGQVIINELYMARSLIDKNKWCRVRAMTETNEEDPKFTVFFVDFGNTADFHKKELMYLSAKLAEKAPFAIQCRLHNPSDTEWSKDSHDELAKLLGDHSEVIMINQGYSDGVFTVELQITYSSGELKSVTDLLIDGCDAMNVKEDDPTIGGSCKIFDNSDSFVRGLSYEIILTHVQDPENIYFHKASYKDSFDSLNASMKKHYENSKCDIHIPVENSFAVVNYPSAFDRRWHRALILQVFIVSKSVKVFLVDLGNIVTVPWKFLRRLSELFKISECLAVCGKLSEIDSKNPKGWVFDEEPRLYLEEYVVKQTVLKMLVSNTEPLEMVLFEQYSTYDENINAVLVERGLAVSTGNLSTTTMWLHKNEEDQLDENEFLPIYKINSDDEDSEETVEGVKVFLEIVGFDNPHCIYGFLKSKKEVAERLHEELQIHYRQEMDIQPSWTINDKIVVFNNEDRFYYRGKIVEISIDTYHVYLLDVGRIIKASKEDLRRISPYFSNSIPNLVLKCQLGDIKPAGDNNKWSRMSLEWFEKLFKKHKNVYVRKISDDVSKKVLPVTMWYTKIIQGSALEPSKCKYFSINKKAVDAGLAFWVKPADQKTINKETTPFCSQLEQSTSDQDISELSIDSNGKTSTPNIHIALENGKRFVTQASPILKKPETVEATMNEWLPPDPLKEKDFEAYITCAENEGYLFVRDSKRHEIYKALEVSMKNFFESLPKTRKKRFEAKEKQMVTIRSNNEWYRGEILSVIDRNTVKAIMIDFGSDHITKLEHIYNIVMHTDVPTLVTKIKLYDVHAKSGTWTEDDVNILLDIISERSLIKIRSGLSSEIPLADVYDEDGCCLNDRLAYLSPNLYRKKNTKKLKFNPDASEVLDDNPDEENVEENEYPYAKLNCNEKVKVDIISVYDYKTISIYLVKDNAMKETFNEIYEQIQAEAPNLETLEDLRLNQPCLSLFSEDEEWYRAKILKIKDEDITVFYVDYGNFETVKVSTIKPIKKEWMNFPARFLVAEIPIESNGESTDVFEHMEKIIGMSKLVKVIDKVPLKIHIYDDDIGTNFYYHELIANGSIRLL